MVLKQIVFRFYLWIDYFNDIYENLKFLSNESVMTL